MNLAGAILAGGKNSRMQGQDKAFIHINGIPIIQRTIRLLKTVFDEIIIVTNSPENYAPYKKDCLVVCDIIKYKGPLGGIYSALMNTSRRSVFFVACDMPFLHIGLINRLLDAAKGEDADCIVPYSDGGIEPLCAVYSKGILPRLQDSLNKENLSIRQFLSTCNCKYIAARPEELPSFFNINTSQDLNEINLYENKV